MPRALWWLLGDEARRKAEALSTEAAAAKQALQVRTNKCARGVRWPCVFRESLSAAGGGFTRKAEALSAEAAAPKQTLQVLVFVY